MKWIGERVSFKDHKDSVTFVIYPPQIGYKKNIVLAWFVLWLIIGGTVVSQFFYEYSNQETIALFIFMSFWTYFAVRVLRTLLYLFRGREFIKLDQTALRIKSATGKYGKARQYLIENISKFSVVEMKDTSFQKVFEDSAWVRGTPRLRFEYMGKSIGFGRKLEEKDAKLMFQIITKRITKYIRQKEKTNAE
ncbi:MAG: hypothetical protein ACQERC_12560 [Bacteroidota bacterium]